MEYKQGKKRLDGEKAWYKYRVRIIKCSTSVPVRKGMVLRAGVYHPVLLANQGTNSGGLLIVGYQVLRSTWYIIYYCGNTVVPTQVRRMTSTVGISIRVRYPRVCTLLLI